MYRQLRQGAPVLECSYAEVSARVKRIGEALIELGSAPGDAVAILSGTRPEWLEADLGILCAGGATASIYQSLPCADIAYILYDSGAKIVFAENQEQVDKLLKIHGESWNISASEDRPERRAELNIKKIIAFESVDDHPLVWPWRKVLETQASADFRPADRKAGDLAALVYTSGTTGPPKGVMQSHLNHLSNVRQAFDSGMVRETSSIMLFLPLAHSFAKLMGYIGFLTPVVLNFPSVRDTRTSKVDPRAILEDIRVNSSEIVPVVPRFLEKMKEGIESEARKRSAKGRLVALTLWAARICYAARKAQHHPSMLAAACYEGTAALRRKLTIQLFGPNFSIGVSGGAKLPLAVGEFFDSLGIKILEGYGLTETCVATNVNKIEMNKIGTVGPVLSSDIQMRFEDDGEVIYKGPNIALGYWQRPTATAASWDQAGWFHTGDLGSVDDDGYLTITGRKKELIVTSGGKKISPLAIEEKLKTIPLVSQAVLVGDAKPFCISLLTLEPLALKDWLQQHGAQSADDPKLETFLRARVEEINRGLSSFETVKNILILKEDFSVDNGLLTPTFKTKRKAIEAQYGPQIEALYQKTKK